MLHCIKYGWKLTTYNPFAADETETQCFTLGGILQSGLASDTNAAAT
jgi:hypothetical protein